MKPLEVFETEINYDEKVAEIGGIQISPEDRGKGKARELVEKFERQCWMDPDIEFIKVMAGFQDGFGFFMHMGYLPVRLDPLG